ncbi:MAG: sulfotransferase, partial [Balneolaceae bacterium]
QNMLSKLGLQPYEPDEVEPVVIDSFIRMMNTMYADITDLSENQFIELRFEDLETKPADELYRIYNQLELPDWNKALPLTKNYLSAVADYRKNRYEFDPVAIEKVEFHWGSYLKRWKYTIPDMVTRSN